MAYFGKVFTLASQENYDALVNSFGSEVPDAYKQAMLSHKGTIKLVKNGDQFTFTTSVPGGGNREFTFKNGVPFDDELAGKKCSTTVTMNGNVATAVTTFDNGHTLTITREFSDNQVVATVKSSNFDGVAKRIYKA